MAPQREWLEKDFYKELGVASDASASDIRKAYRKLANELHPDGVLRLPCHVLLDLRLGAERQAFLCRVSRVDEVRVKRSRRRHRKGCPDRSERDVT